MQRSRAIVWIVLADLMVGLWAIEYHERVAEATPGSDPSKLPEACERKRKTLQAKLDSCTDDRQSCTAALDACKSQLKVYSSAVAKVDECAQALEECNSRCKSWDERTGATTEVINLLCDQLSTTGFNPICDKQRGTISIDAAVFGFETDSAAIPSAARAKAVSLGIALMGTVERHSENIRYVLLSAHADCRGSASHNMRLSQERAQAIWEAWRNEPRLGGYFDPYDSGNSTKMLALGGRIIVGGFGEARATRVAQDFEISQCDSASAEKSTDRRIEIELIPSAD